MDELKLRLGSMVATIAQQLAAQGLTAPAHVIDGVEKDNADLNRLYVRGVLTYTQVKDAREKVRLRLAARRDLREVGKGGDA